MRTIWPPNGWRWSAVEVEQGKVTFARSLIFGSPPQAGEGAGFPCRRSRGGRARSGDLPLQVRPFDCRRSGLAGLPQVIGGLPAVLYP